MIGFGRHQRRRPGGRYGEDIARAQGNIAGHVCAPRRSRSFDFRTPGNGSFYAFALTWTPGSLSLAGDCGEMILTHYQALAELEAGLRWATNSDTDYLLGKSNLRQEIDREGTVRWLIDAANERAIDTLRGHRRDLQRWRAEQPSPYAWFDPDDFPLTWDEWRRERPSLDVFEHTRTSDYYPYPKIIRTVPEDGFELWDRLRDEFADHLPVAGVYSARDRREIREELERWISDAPAESIGELTWGKLNMDAGPDTRWSFQAIQGIECIRLGARMALDALAAEQARAA